MFDVVVLIIGLAGSMERLLILGGKEDIHEVTEGSAIGCGHLR